MHAHNAEEPDTPKVMKLAPTVSAAYLIKGSTIHSGININPNISLAEYTSMGAEARSVKNFLWRHLRMLMTDEVSMVGRKFFDFINSRLQEIMDCKKPFGGLHVLLSGDIFQLRPVKDSWAFGPRLHHRRCGGCL